MTVRRVFISAALAKISANQCATTINYNKYYDNTYPTLDIEYILPRFGPHIACRRHGYGWRSLLRWFYLAKNGHDVSVHTTYYTKMCPRIVFLFPLKTKTAKLHSSMFTYKIIRTQVFLRYSPAAIASNYTHTFLYNLTVSHPRENIYLKSIHQKLQINKSLFHHIVILPNVLST